MTESIIHNYKKIKNKQVINEHKLTIKNHS